MPLTILEIMAGLGYEIDEEGMCGGIGRMAIQAILAREFNVLQRRIHLLHSYTDIDQLKKDLHEAKQLSFSYNQLSVEEKLLRSTLPFLDGISLHHFQDKFSYLFPPLTSFLNPAEIFALTLPLKSEKKGKIQKIYSLSGVYSEEDLINYFAILRREFSKTTHPLAFTLENINHLITIGYDAEKQQWLFVSHDKAIKLRTERELALEVLANFNSSCTICVTKIYAHESRQKYVLPCLQLCEADPVWQTIHTPSPQTAKWLDQAETSWLLLAAENGEARTVKLLIHHQTCFSHKPYEANWTPLIGAAENGHVDVIEVLLNNKINIEEENYNRQTALYVAAKYGQVEVVDFLLKKHAHVNPTKAKETLNALANFSFANQREEEFKNWSNRKNLPFLKGLSPLQIAAFTGQVKIIKLLLASHADIYHEAHDLTALDFALLNNHPQSASLLIQAEFKLASEREIKEDTPSARPQIIQQLKEMKHDQQFEDCFLHFRLLERFCKHLPYDESVKKTYEAFFLNMHDHKKIEHSIKELVFHIIVKSMHYKHSSLTLFPAQNPLMTQMEKALENYKIDILLLSQLPHTSLPYGIIKSCKYYNNL